MWLCNTFHTACFRFNGHGQVYKVTKILGGNVSATVIFSDRIRSYS